ncbi:metacaspase-9-like [Magnolia sinica]|uniref:metacaspase-9-like n=1 Tax=Magnolia sinica TaxID=86752 RepID=UPI002659BA2E|nr:metacaspase-9-like [Magnolia sinica]
MAVTNKLALLVGCNYTNNHKVPVENKLHGCINDVNAVQALIRQRFGFQDKNITILTEETEMKPTSYNIMYQLKSLIDAAKPGDTLLFYFSGGGAVVKHTVKNKITDIPAIVPSDLHPITVDFILPKLNLLPDGAFFTFICDSSYSGGLFHNEVQIESNVRDPGSNFRRKTIPSNLLQSHNVFENLAAGISLNNKFLFSSSKANEESVEVYPNGDESKAISAFSNAIQTLLNSPQAVNPSVAGNHLNALYNIWEVAAYTKAVLGILGFDQHPYVNYGDNTAAASFLGGYVA